jgi:hypothetical protein
MKTPNKSRLLLAGLTASALVFASCGGGGSSYNSGGNSGGSGSNGLVVITYDDTKADLGSIGVGLTYTLTQSGGKKIYQFTAGSGNVSW